MAGVVWLNGSSTMRGRKLVLMAAFLTAATGVCAKDLPPIRQVVSFGDSLSDAGTYGFRFTTNPGMTFAQLLAVHYGQLPLPNEHLDTYSDVYKGTHGIPGPGGLNYAEGGARANSAYSAVSNDVEGLPISTTIQLRHFLAQHRAFTPDQLVTLYVGTNDAVYHYDPSINADLAKQLRDNRPPSDGVMHAEKARVEKAADSEAQMAKDIIAHGARRLVVFKLVNLGQLPWFHTVAARAFATELGQAYNRRLVEQLPKDPQRVLVIDTAAFVNGVIANAVIYGITHGANEDACRQDDQDHCFATTLKDADADRSYIFAAEEHMSTRANVLLAEYVLKKISESPLK